MTKSAKLIAGAPGDALDAMRADQQRSIMKYLVVGGGSMGKRRIRCLLANNVKPEQIRMVDVRADRQAEVKEKHNVDSLSDLGAGLEWNPDAVVVSAPGAAHMEVNLAAARRKKHVFCEVPLATSLEGVEELSKLVEQHKLTFASGCQPPMHPLFKQVKQWMSDERFQLLPQYAGAKGGRSTQESGLDCAVVWPAGSLAALGGKTVRFRINFEQKEGSDPRLFAVYLRTDCAWGPPARRFRPVSVSII
jgi:hypothetical protein